MKRCFRVLALLAVFIAGTIVSGNATVINFDYGPNGAAIAAPSLFKNAYPLNELYAPIGVHFSGPSALDGGAILNQQGNFGVNAHSGTNFLAFYTKSDGAAMLNGGHPFYPETISFDTPVSTVSLYVAGGSVDLGPFTCTLNAYDVNGQCVATAVASGSPWSQISVSWAQGIRKVVMTDGSDGAFVCDDLHFTPVPEPSSIFAMLCGIGGMSAVIWRRKSV